MIYCYNLSAFMMVNRLQSIVLSFIFVSMAALITFDILAFRNSLGNGMQVSTYVTALRTKDSETDLPDWTDVETRGLCVEVTATLKFSGHFKSGTYYSQPFPDTGPCRFRVKLECLLHHVYLFITSYRPLKEGRIKYKLNIRTGGNTKISTATHSRSITATPVDFPTQINKTINQRYNEWTPVWSFQNTSKIDTLEFKVSDITNRDGDHGQRRYTNDTILRVLSEDEDHEVITLKSKDNNKVLVLSAVVAAKTPNLLRTRQNLLPVDFGTLLEFRKWLYEGKLSKTEHLPELYKIAKTYEIDALTKNCTELLIEGLTPQNALQSLQVALKYNTDQTVLKAIVRYIHEHEDTCFLNSSMDDVDLIKLRRSLSLLDSNESRGITRKKSH